MFTIDFESAPIGLRPTDFPPKSVGVAIQPAGAATGHYLAYGHPSGNNATWEDARRALTRIWDQPIITHNGGAFDLLICAEEFGLPFPNQWEDTLYELFLLYPHERNLSLKPSAERLLGIPPSTRDAVRDWVMQNVPGAKLANWGAHIGSAPGGLVGAYAADDVRMTSGLHSLLHPQILSTGMAAAYQREKLLAPILHQSSIRGIRCDTELLASDLWYYQAVLRDLDTQIRTVLRAPNLNIDSDTDLANALDAMGLGINWVMTPTGRRSTSKKNMAVALAGHPITALLNYRGSLSTCIGTFMEPWLRLAQATGRVYPTWNQTRQPEGGGARTGRVTCQDPNLLNVPKEFPVLPPPGLPPLPLMRRYLLPEEGHVWCRRDYQQQELRILAHYEDGQMMDQYNLNPKVDFHDLARQLILINTGTELQRKDVKTTAFSILYGAGADSMAAKLGCTKERAQELKNAYYQAIPGIRKVQNEIRYLVNQGRPIRTWGGRLYYCEEPWVDPKTGKRQTYEYKLLNYLIQGSAADCTKQAIINYDAACRYGQFTVQVYDEMNMSCPPECMKQEMRILSESMADVKFDVPMLSDGSYGANYQDLTETA